jgi:para-aminobenzoate synthetase/4-amino-4-deoxychorismate lyase
MLRVPLDWSLTVGEVLRAVRDEPRPFALVGSWAGSRAIVGWDPSRVVEDDFPPDVAAVASGEGVGGGWFGTLGYGLGSLVERLPAAPPRPVVTPVASLGFYEHVLRLDADGRWWFESLRDDAVVPALPVAAPRSYALSPLALHGGGAGAHVAAVAECVERIAAGELFQANLCVRLDGTFSGDPVEAFLAGVDELQPAFGAYVGRPDGAVLSFSPELFLRRRGRAVETAPIKGTAPRVPGARERLLASAKDAAEHVMIVDLMRNDLGRVAAYGSVAADPEPAVEPHPGLWHLVSRVRARLRDDVGDRELLRATFPPGSVTGAPKVQALKVISELEGTGREVYTGAVGMLSPVAGVELNVAIRTLEVRGEHAWLGAGGGIVADSGPEAELREALVKARPIAEALGASVADLPRVAVVAAPVLPRVRRPDPSLGLVETVLLEDGVPVDLDAHMARLAASARAVYGLDLGSDLAFERLPGRCRVRITVRADGTHRVDVEPAPAGAPDPVALVPHTLTGGLGAHKWADRPAPPDALLVDLDGTVLEGAFANVWAIEGETLVTPPADGRLLPGTVRARLLERAECVEAPLTLERLRDADGLVLTSSIRLATPAGLPHPTPRAVEVAERLRALLTPALTR